MKPHIMSPVSNARTRRSRASDRHVTSKNTSVNPGGEGGGESGEWYDVEEIKGHRIKKNRKLELHVKWDGYESEKDLTWEPEESLRKFVPKIVEAYLASVGGRPNLLSGKQRSSRRKKRPLVAPATADTMSLQRGNGASPTEKATSVTTESWTPPVGLWEDEIDNIDACEDEGGGRLVVYLVWKNGRKTKHETSVVYRRCPQKMLQFYERHIRIVKD